jgi:hypothetical protein
MSEHTSAFRFVYPTLIVAARDRAYLWDIPSGKLIQTLQEFQLVTHDEAVGRIKYVEISERHIFIVGQSHLRVFSRATGKSVLDLSASKWRYGFWKYMPHFPHDRTPGSALVRYEMESTQESYGSANRAVYDRFIAGTSSIIVSLDNELSHAKAHVSACGCHFTALLSGCRLLIVYDFEKVSNEEELYAQTLDIRLASHRFYLSIYLAFDYGRISVVTVSHCSF